MRQGVLVHDPKQDRMDVRFGLDEFYGGLHCGQPLDIWLKSRWYPTRIEKSTNWYFDWCRYPRPCGAPCSHLSITTINHPHDSEF